MFNKLKILFVLLLASESFGGTIRFYAHPTAAAPAGNSDSFTNTTGTALATHNANWVDLGMSGHDISNCDIDGNTVNSDSAGSGCAAMYDASTSDISQIVFKPDNTSGDGYKGVCVRGSGSVTGYCASFSTPGGGYWTSILVSKNESYHGSCGSLSYDRTTDHTVKIKASGTGTVTIDVYVDGNLDCTKTDSSTPYDSGKPGFYSMQANMEARGQLDDWQDYE